MISISRSAKRKTTCGFIAAAAAAVVEVDRMATSLLTPCHFCVEKLVTDIMAIPAVTRVPSGSGASACDVHSE